MADRVVGAKQKKEAQSPIEVHCSIQVPTFYIYGQHFMRGATLFSKSPLNAKAQV